MTYKQFETHVLILGLAILQLRRALTAYVQGTKDLDATTHADWLAKANAEFADKIGIGRLRSIEVLHPSGAQGYGVIARGESPGMGIEEWEVLFSTVALTEKDLLALRLPPLEECSRPPDTQPEEGRRNRGRSGLGRPSGSQRLAGARSRAQHGEGLQGDKDSAGQSRRRSRQHEQMSMDWLPDTDDDPPGA